MFQQDKSKHCQNKRSRLRRLIFLGVAIISNTIVLGGIIHSPVYADDGGSEKSAIRIQISPVSNRVTLTAGETRDYTFNVDNIGSEAFSFKVYANPYSVTNEKYNISFSDQTMRTQLSRWVTFKNDAGEYVNESIYSVEPGQRKEISYRVKVPTDIPGGGQYAVLFAEAIPKDDNTGGVRTVSRVGLVLFGRTNGETKEVAEILNHNLDSFYLTGKIKTTGSVKNSGNTDFRATFKIKVEKIFGGTVFEDTKGYDVLPDTNRDIELVWEDTPAFGVYRITSTLSAIDQSRTTTKIVLILPVFIIIILLMLLTITIVWFIILFRKRQAQKSKLII